MKHALLRLLCAEAVLLTVQAANATAHAEGNQVCVATPAQYKDAWEKCAPIACVGPNLYSTIAVGAPDQIQTPYPRGFKWAWSNGYENLKKYADWHMQQCRQSPNSGWHMTPRDVTRNILLYVGFGPSSIVRGQSYTLLVMDLGQDTSRFVPTAEGWFNAFQGVYNVKVPPETQKVFTLNLKNDQLNQADPAIPVNPTRNFVRITGCNATSAAACSDSPLSACKSDYRDMANAIKAFLPYNPSSAATTDNCVAHFQSYLADKHRPATPAEVRAMLVYCQDVNPCNSQLGLGFNPSYPNAGGSVYRHFTGREYVFLNQQVERLGAAKVPLAPP